jgi:hypothetical protein
VTASGVEGRARRGEARLDRARERWRSALTLGALSGGVAPQDGESEDGRMSTGEVAELVGLIYNGMQSSSALALPRIVSASEVGARVLRLVPSDLAIFCWCRKNV